MSLARFSFCRREPQMRASAIVRRLTLGCMSRKMASSHHIIMNSMLFSMRSQSQPMSSTRWMCSKQARTSFSHPSAPRSAPATSRKLTSGASGCSATIFSRITANCGATSPSPPLAIRLTSGSSNWWIRSGMSVCVSKQSLRLTSVTRASTSRQKILLKKGSARQSAVLLSSLKCCANSAFRSPSARSTTTSKDSWRSMGSMMPVISCRYMQKAMAVPAASPSRMILWISQRQSTDSPLIQMSEMTLKKVLRLGKCCGETKTLVLSCGSSSRTTAQQVSKALVSCLRRREQIERKKSSEQSTTSPQGLPKFAMQVLITFIMKFSKEAFDSSWMLRQRAVVDTPSLHSCSTSSASVRMNRSAASELPSRASSQYRRMMPVCRSVACVFGSSCAQRCSHITFAPAPSARRSNCSNSPKLRSRLASNTGSSPSQRSVKFSISPGWFWPYFCMTASVSGPVMRWKASSSSPWHSSRKAASLSSSNFSLAQSVTAAVISKARAKGFLRPSKGAISECWTRSLKKARTWKRRRCLMSRRMESCMVRCFWTMSRMACRQQPSQKRKPRMRSSIIACAKLRAKSRSSSLRKVYWLAQVLRPSTRSRLLSSPRASSKLPAPRTSICQYPTTPRSSPSSHTTCRKKLGRQMSPALTPVMFSLRSSSISNSCRLSVKGYMKTASRSARVSAMTGRSCGLASGSRALRCSTPNCRKQGRQLFRKTQMHFRYSQQTLLPCTDTYSNIDVNTRTARQYPCRFPSSACARGSIVEATMSAELLSSCGFSRQAGRKAVSVLCKYPSLLLSSSSTFRHTAARSTSDCSTQRGRSRPSAATAAASTRPCVRDFCEGVSARERMFSSERVSVMLQKSPLSMSLSILVAKTKTQVSESASASRLSSRLATSPIMLRKRSLAYSPPGPPRAISSASRTSPFRNSSPCVNIFMIYCSDAIRALQTATLENRRTPRIKLGGIHSSQSRQSQER